MAAHSNEATQATAAVLIAMIENKLVTSPRHEESNEATNLRTAENIAAMFDVLYQKIRTA